MTKVITGTSEPVEKVEQAQLTKKKNTKRKIVKVKDFSIAHIPRTMDKLGWVEGARFMRRWFTSPAYIMPNEYKTGEKDDRELRKAGHVLENLDFNWLNSASPRTKAVVAQLEKDFSGQHRQYGRRIGMQKGILNHLTNGLVQFIERLIELGLVSHDKKRLVAIELADFSDRTAIELDKTTQFNLERVGTSLWEKATDDLDDVYGALGAFAIKMAVTKFSIRHDDKLGFSILSIHQVGLYIRDTYDFNGKQLLGYWNRSSVLKPSIWQYYVSDPDNIDVDGSRYFKVGNIHFQAYRKKYKKGGDFMVYSTVKFLDTDIEIHLSAVDIQEGIDRAKAN